MEGENKKEKYSVRDFIYWLEKNNYELIDDKKFTQGQIASIIAKAMVCFFDDSETPY